MVTPHLSLRFDAPGTTTPEDVPGLIERFVVSLTGHTQDVLEEVRPTPTGFDVQLYPTALPVRIGWHGAGLIAEADTFEIGPGYHTYVERALREAAEDAGFGTDGAPAPWEHIMERVAAFAKARAADILVGAGPRHLGLRAARPTHDAAVLTAMGTRDRAWLEALAAGGDDAEEALATTLSWWTPTTHFAHDAELLRRRAVAQLTVSVPRRAPMTETEVARLETICDDLEAGYALDPELHWPLGEWRYLQDLLGALRETPKHLLSVSASTDALRRVGHVRIAAARPAHLTLPATMIGGYRDDGSYWAADETRELWMQVGHVELEPGSPTPPADVLLDSTGEWSPAAVRSTDRRYEFETRDGVRVLHGAVVLEDDDGELHVVLLTMRCDDDHDAVAALESVSIVA